MNRNVGVIVLLFCGLFGFHAWTQEACACKPQPPHEGINVERRTFWPENEATDVPVNAEVAVLYTLHQDTISLDMRYPEYRKLKLREKGGAAVSASVLFDLPKGRRLPFLYPVVVLKPIQALKAQTTYEVLSTIWQTPCESFWDCTPNKKEDEYRVVSTFTTGSRRLAKTSQQAEIEVTQLKLFHFKDDCDPGDPERGACCQPESKTTGFLFVMKKRVPASLRYNIYRVLPDATVERLLRRYPNPPGGRISILGSIRCIGDWMKPISLDGKEHPKEARLMVRAVDMAGNEGPDSNIVVVPSLCAQSAGCGCSTRGANAPSALSLSWVWLLGLAGLLWVGWRRERKYSSKVVR